MAEGWIKIYRNIQEHWIWQDSQKLKWWFDIILLANYKDNKLLLGNEIVTIERGEHHTSEVKLSERWGVNRKTVRKFLKLLESDGMIEVKKTPKGTTIKVTNYSNYQDFGEDKVTPKRTAESHTIVQDKPQYIPSEIYSTWDTNNNEKNRNNDKNDKKEKKEKEVMQNQSPIYSMLKKSIITTFGEVAFNTWFKPCDIDDGDELVIKAPNNFTREILENKFSEYVKKITGKEVRIAL